jgi:dihydrodipicolinate synthase/N-acetylneuraminate lyase
MQSSTNLGDIILQKIPSVYQSNFGPQLVEQMVKILKYIMCIKNANIM